MLMHRYTIYAIQSATELYKLQIQLLWSSKEKAVELECQNGEQNAQNYCSAIHCNYK